MEQQREVQRETLSTAASECAERLLSEPEVRNYIARILRIAFMEGCIWSKEQQLVEMKVRAGIAGQSSMMEAATNAN